MGPWGKVLFKPCPNHPNQVICHLLKMPLCKQWNALMSKLSLFFPSRGSKCSSILSKPAWQCLIGSIESYRSAVMEKGRRSTNIAAGKTIQAPVCRHRQGLWIWLQAHTGLPLQQTSKTTYVFGPGPHIPEELVLQPSWSYLMLPPEQNLPHALYIADISEARASLSSGS